MRTRLLMAGLLGLPASLALAVTLVGDAVPHLWHSFNTPDNAFLGAAGYDGPAWGHTDAGALYAEWGGFIPDGRNLWVFSTPTVGLRGASAAVLAESSGTGLLTATGNIYGLAFGQTPGPPLVFALTLHDAAGAAAAAGQTRSVVLRSGTKGTLPDTNVLLNGMPATAWTATFRVDGSIDMPTGPGGAIESVPAADAEWLWRWDEVPVAASYRFDLRSTIGHMSLDNLAAYASPPRAAAPQPSLRAAVVPVHALASQLSAIAAAQNP